MPSPRFGYRNPANGGASPGYGNPRPRSLQMQKVDSDYSTNASRRNSEISRIDDRVGQETKKLSNKIDSAAESGSEKLRQAKTNLSDDIGYVAAGSRRASKYDLY